MITRKRKKPEEFIKRMTTVGAKIPEDFVNLFDRNVKKLEYTSISDYIRDLIREDMKRRKLLK